MTRRFPALPRLVRASVPAAALVSITLSLSTMALAKLPAPTDEARAKAAEASAKAAWSARTAAFQLCQVQDRLAKRFGDPGAASSSAAAPAGPGACTDPGPFVPVAVNPKPMESAGAHSPAATVTAPPASK